MKISTSQWHKVKVNENFEVYSGIVHVRANEIVTVYVEQRGQEVILGSGYEVRGEVKGQAGVRVKATKNADAFYFSVKREMIMPDPEKQIFTNSDRVVLDGINPQEGALRLRRIAENAEMREKTARIMVAEKRKAAEKKKAEEEAELIEKEAKSLAQREAEAQAIADLDRGEE